MERTLESAMSTGALVGHLSYLLLVVLMIMRVIWGLRVLVILSAFAAIAYDMIWLKDPVGVFWESLLVLVNIVQLSVTYFQNRRQKFDTLESSFVHSAFPGLSNTLQRKTLRHGEWEVVGEGTELPRAGEPVRHLIYLAEGEAEITVGGHVVGYCRTGDLIGELTVLSAKPATGTAITMGPTRCWTIPGDVLRKLVASNDEISQAVQACIHLSMLSKLVAANRELGNSGGLREAETR